MLYHNRQKHRWDKYNKRWICCGCHLVTTLTSGTVMHGCKLPLLYWFTAMHLLTSTKKTFSASELQRQLGHKRYQPIWEMLHKLRSVMGQRDEKYKLSDTIELDEGYFTTEDPTDEEDSLKRGIGSQRKAKVLVMVESEPVESPEKGKKNRKCGHLKMKVIQDLQSSTFESKTKEAIAALSTTTMQNTYVHFHLLTKDVDDNKFVDCAIASNAELIVTNDKDFDPLKSIPWPKVVIMNINDFINLIKG